MKNIINQLPSNPWITLISLILAIFSILLAIYFGTRSLPRKKIKVIFENNELISVKKESLSKLNIIYDNKNIEKLTITKMIFWNDSFPTIYNTDIVGAVPFSVLLIDGELLDVSILEGDDTANCINISLVDSKHAQISFDYLDRKEGGIIQIIHTGIHNSVDVTKLLKGGKISSAKSTIFNKFMLSLAYALCILPMIIFLYHHSKIWFTFPTALFTAIFMGIVEGFSSDLSTNRRFIPKNCRKRNH